MEQAPSPMSDLFFQTAAATAPLQEVIKSCWLMQSAATEVQPVPDLLIPDGFPELIFVFAGGYRKVALAAPEAVQQVETSCLVGMQTETQLVTRLSPVHLLGVKLTPIGGARLLGPALAAASGRNQPLAELDAPWLAPLATALQACATAAEGLACLERHLLPQLRPLSPALAQTGRCLQALVETKGQLPIRELAQQQALSLRQLQRCFKTYLGITPKQFARLLRFKALYKDSVVQQVQPRDYFRYGYFDQMHFIKDFKAHLGITPGRSRDQRFQQQNDIARRSQG